MYDLNNNKTDSTNTCEHLSANFPKFIKVALNPMYRFFFLKLCQRLYPIVLIKIPTRKNFTVPYLKYKRLKLKFRLFLAGHSVAMITYCVTKITPTCSPVIGQFFDTMIVASIDKEW